MCSPPLTLQSEKSLNKTILFRRNLFWHEEKNVCRSGTFSFSSQNNQFFSNKNYFFAVMIHSILLTVTVNWLMNVFMYVYMYVQLIWTRAKETSEISFILYFLCLSAFFLVKNCSMLDQTWQMGGKFHWAELCFCFKPKQNIIKLTSTWHSN